MGKIKSCNFFFKLVFTNEMVLRADSKNFMKYFSQETVYMFGRFLNFQFLFYTLDGFKIVNKNQWLVYQA